MKFFKFENGEIVLDKAEIALYSNFKKILSRDRGGRVPGDPDGRLKMYAFREFAYIYFKCDFEAYPSQHGLNEQEAHHYAVQQARLEKNYDPDEVVKAAMRQYENEHLSPGKKSIKSLIRLFVSNDRIVSKIENNITATLDLPTLTRDQITELLTYQKQLIEIATSVPAQVKKLREAMTLLEEEDKEVKIARGGSEVALSMDPENDIEN